MELARIFAEMADFHGLLGSEHRKNAYMKVSNYIGKFGITEKIPGAGKVIGAHIKEYLETNKLTAYIDMKNSKEYRAAMIFNKIIGVGPATIRKWLSMNIFTIATLRRKMANKSVKLTNMQKYGLMFYSDLNSRIPRDEVLKLSLVIKTRLMRIDPDVLFEICGSYRRLADSSGDIDILISNRKFYDENILTGFSAVIEDENFVACLSKGAERLTFLYKSPISGKVRQIDILNIRYGSYWAAILYFTGTYEFNTRMRGLAKSKGYRLNQNGLYKNGQIIQSGSERDIFEILEIPYVEPKDR